MAEVKEQDMGTGQGRVWGNLSACGFCSVFSGEAHSLREGKQPAGEQSKKVRWLLVRLVSKSKASCSS